MINHLGIILGEGTHMKENYDPTNHSNGQTLDKTRSYTCIYAYIRLYRMFIYSLISAYIGI